MNGPDPLALLYSVLLGAGLGLLFAAFLGIRLALFPGRVARFMLDLLFCLIASMASFLLALAVADGTLRFFQAGGEILGFLAVQTTVTWAVRRGLPRALRALRRVSNRVERFFLEK